MKCIKIIILLCLCIIFLSYKSSLAKEENQECSFDELYSENYLDYTEINKMISQMDINENIDFKSYVDSFRQSKGMNVTHLISKFKNSLLQQLQKGLIEIKSIFILAVISGLCISFFKGTPLNSMGESAVNIAYIIIGCTVIIIFSECYVCVSKTVSLIIDFIKVLLPTYVAVMAFCSGTFTATGYSLLTMIIISSVNIILIALVMPVTRMYMIINVCGNFLDDNRFSRLGKMLLKFGRFVVKSMIVLVCAISMFQKMILPYKDMASRQTVLCAVKSIPVVGATVSGISDLVFASSILLRNSIGIAAVVIIILFISVPFMRILLMLALLNFASAITQPVTDKKISKLLEGTASGIGMMMMVMFTCTSLFVIALAVVSI